MKTELLAPAGSYVGMKAAFLAGADAVYMGGRLFGARAYADNPEEDGLLSAIDYAHLRNKRLYLTVNTLLKNQELFHMLYDYLAPCYERGLDGIIVQDLGVLSFLKRQFPSLAIHASTQMAVTGVHGARLLKESGVTRIVTARELSLDEISNIYQSTGLEIECFIHGALCYSYSGMCLFSSLLGGRSGNRGRCAQPCRLPYQVYDNRRRVGQKNVVYPLSLKDMCTIDLLPEILEAGVLSLKIEGRMKKPEYAAGVTRIYRKYLDAYEKDAAHYKVEDEDKRELLELYQRDGFNQGYYHVRNGKDMVALFNQKAETKRGKGKNTRDEELFSHLKSTYIEQEQKVTIHGSLELYAEGSAVFNAVCRDISVKIEQKMVEPAKNQPLDEERLRRQMKKTGNTPFVFDELAIHMDDNVFVPMQGINELRRQGLAALEEKCLSAFHRELPGRQPYLAEDTVGVRLQDNVSAVMFASVETAQQFQAVIANPLIKGVYISISMLERKQLLESGLSFLKQARKRNKELYLALPYLLRNADLEDCREIFTKLVQEGMTGFLVRNLESAGLLKEWGLFDRAVLDFHVYTCNEEAVHFWKKEQALALTLPVELNAAELKSCITSDSEMLIYGYYPMMISAQCVKKTMQSCTHSDSIIQLKDRYNAVFNVSCVCDFCYNIIYNSIPLGLLAESREVKAMGASRLRLSFTTEDYQTTKKIADSFTAVYFKSDKIPDAMPNFTKGHFKRGVE